MDLCRFNQRHHTEPTQQFALPRIPMKLKKKKKKKKKKTKTLFPPTLKKFSSSTKK